MKKVNFKKVPVKNIDGTVESVDVSKNLGNSMYIQGRSLEVVTLATKIWEKGEVEINEEEESILRGQIPQLFPAYILRTALLAMLNGNN